jgi:hypothetical protein
MSEYISFMEAPMRINSILSSALAAVMVGSLTLTAASATAQSVGGHSRGNQGQNQGSKGQSNPPRTERHGGQRGQSQSQQRGQSQDDHQRVADQNRKREEQARQNAEKARREQQNRQREDAAKRARSAENQRRLEAEKRARADQNRRQEAQMRARSDENRRRQEAEKRSRSADNQRRLDAEKRARAEQNRRREEAAARARADQNRREEAARISQLRRAAEVRRTETVGGITNNRLSGNRSWQIAEARRRAEEARWREEQARRDREEARREQERRDRWERDNRRVQVFNGPMSVSDLSGRDDRFDDWFNVGTLRVGRTVHRDNWDHYVLLQPKKAKRHGPPPWANARFNRPIYVVRSDPYYDDTYYDDGYYDDSYYDDSNNGVIYASNDPWENGYGDSWRSEPLMTYTGIDSWQDAYDHRQDTKNEWRNIAYLSGAVLAYGLIKHDNTVAFAGGAGALYSLYRYEQDRKSQNDLKRLRATYFSHDYFYRDGVRYDRRLVTRDGVKYYQFVRV